MPNPVHRRTEDVAAESVMDFVRCTEGRRRFSSFLFHLAKRARSTRATTWHVDAELVFHASFSTDLADGQIFCLRWYPGIFNPSRQIAKTGFDVTSEVF